MKKIRKQTLEELTEQTNEILKKQLILQLVQMKLPNQEIRKIVGVSMNYITGILRPLKKIK